jgi:hypothetical protein
VAAGFIAGCTAIIDGAEDWPAGDKAAPQGAEPEGDDALGGHESVVATGNGGAIEPASGGFTAESGSPTSSWRGGAGGRPASETNDAGAAGQLEPLGPAGAGGANGTAGQSATAGDTSAAGTAGAGGTGKTDEVGGARQPVIGDPAKGHQILILDNCYRCHGDNLAGRSFYPNITPDIETGIGGWTDKQISTAIRGAIGPDGELFCAVMPLYSGFKPQQIADLIAFLRIVPAVNNPIVAVCPGHNP